MKNLEEYLDVQGKANLTVKDQLVILIKVIQIPKSEDLLLLIADNPRCQ